MTIYLFKNGHPSIFVDTIKITRGFTGITDIVVEMDVLTYEEASLLIGSQLRSIDTFGFLN